MQFKIHNACLRFFYMVKFYSYIKACIRPRFTKGSSPKHQTNTMDKKLNVWRHLTVEPFHVLILNRDTSLHFPVKFSLTPLPSDSIHALYIHIVYKPIETTSS